MTFVSIFISLLSSFFFSPNASASLRLTTDTTAQHVRPFAEYEPVRYVVMSAGFDYQTMALKRKVLQNLPDGVTALIYSTSDRELEVFRENTADLALSNVDFISIHKYGEALWARDSWPYPVWIDGEPTLIDAPYYEGFAPDSHVASYFKLGLKQHDRYFEHGNLTTNRLGDCVVVMEHFTRLISNETFADFYGCRDVTRLPFVTGIGHVDEVVKFMGDHLVLTSRQEFVSVLESKGFHVILLPEAKLPEDLARRGVMPQRSYINSLLVNDTVFVPIFGLSTDSEAIHAYESLGLKVIPVDSTYVADYGGGALHCLTMTYPDFERSTTPSLQPGK